MVTDTQSRTKQVQQVKQVKQVKQVSSKPLPKWQRQGYSSYEDFLYHRQNREGTNTSRYEPRHKTPNLNQVKAVSAREMVVLDDLFNALDRTVERESAYAKDGDQHYLFMKDEVLTIALDGTEYLVGITQCWNVFDRLRYRLYFFAEDVYLVVTQQQLVRIHVKPLVSVAPTHLLPAGDPQTFTLQGATFTSREAFEKALVRLSANWNHQMSKFVYFEAPCFFGTLKAASK